MPFFIVRTFSTPLSPSCLQELLFDKRVVNPHYTEAPFLEARQRVYHEEDQGPDLGELSQEDAHKADEGGLREMLWGATGAETGGKGVWVMCLIRSEDHCSQRGSERFSDPTSRFLDEKSESPGKGVLSIKPRTYPRFSDLPGPSVAQSRFCGCCYPSRQGTQQREPRQPTTIQS